MTRPTQGRPRVGRQNFQGPPNESPRRSTAPGPAPAPLFDRTGYAAIDAFGDVINTNTAGFRQTPPSNPVFAAAHYVNAAMGVMGLIDQGFETWQALMAAPLNFVIPPMPAAQLYSPMLGIPHTHVHPPSLVPPAPPCPLPSIGAGMLAGSLSVLVSYVPALRAGDVGPAVACGSLGPPFEIVAGSNNVFFAGARAARFGIDMTFHDNPSPLTAVGAIMMAVGHVGTAANMVSLAGQGQALMAAASAAQTAADTAAAAMSMMRMVDPGGPPSVGAMMRGWPTVLVGGAPTPNISATSMIMESVSGLARAMVNKRRGRGRGTGHPEGHVTDQPSTCPGGGGC